MAEKHPVSLTLRSPFLFSVCTIVTDRTEYADMCASFEQCGFTENCEYLYADNVGENQFDAYVAIRRFLQEAKGEYVIIVHQDVRCVDTLHELKCCLLQLEESDSSWAICGNAGGEGYKKFVFYIQNKGTFKKSESLPRKVFSLDENLLIIKRSSGLAISADIGNFHFYGTDLCIIADYLGYSSYVIPFMVNHLSAGNMNALFEAQPGFIEKYGRKLRHRFIQTTCTKFQLSHSASRNKSVNSGIRFELIKFWNRLKG